MTSGEHPSLANKVRQGSVLAVLLLHRCLLLQPQQKGAGLGGTMMTTLRLLLILSDYNKPKTTSSSTECPLAVTVVCSSWERI